MKRFFELLAAGALGATIAVLSLIYVNDKRADPRSNLADEPRQEIASSPLVETTATPAQTSANAPPEPPKSEANTATSTDHGNSADDSENMSYRLKRIADAFSSSSDFKVISAADLSVQSHKWDQKIIQVELSCFYADAGDFRCTGPHSRVDFTSLYPDSEREIIERDCDTITKSQTRKCRRTLRFTYEGFEEMDVGGLFGKITVARAGLNIGVIMPRRDQSKAKRAGR
jgi:hypothetical protein